MTIFLNELDYKKIYSIIKGLEKQKLTDEEKETIRKMMELLI